MTKCLNITNGDGAAGLLRASTVAGDILAWHDLMFEGPFPAGLDLEATSKLRAAYFAKAYPKDGDAARQFQDRDRGLAAGPQYDRIVLWFEHDLLDQLQLLQLLDWFADTDLGDTALDLVCIGAYPGIDPFRGLGQLTPEQVATLLDDAAPVSQAQLRLGKAGWVAFRSPDPRAIETYLREDLGSLPFLHSALSRHLEEFPSVRNGLGRTDRQLLELISDGNEEPGALFADNMARETAMFIGDWCTFRHVGALCNGENPLLQTNHGGPFNYPPCSDLPMAEFRDQRLSLTDTGQRVLANDADATTLNAFNYWLGGVHLQSGQPSWR